MHAFVIFSLNPLAPRGVELEGEELVCARLDQLRANFSRILAVSTNNW